jgi:DNA (cytosine-5)-methyltransferase 1
VPLTKPIKYLDMFAGIGGFRSGLSQFGDFFIPVGFCEIDPYTKKAYEAIYDTKGELYFHDARDIIPEDLPDIDLICGGFPCQSFSIAGKRGGFEDARGTLFFEIARIARVKRPSYLLLENVPGLLSHDKGRTFATILTALDELGYHVSWQVLNSADFGVPQSRKRVFLVCYLGDECPGEVLSFTEANPKTIIQKVKGRQGDRIYDTDGLSCTLTSGAGGFAGNTGLYDTGEILIKSFTKSGFQIAEPGDSIDLAYPNLNSRRGRVGKQIAHTITPNITQGVYCLDMNPDPKITELARCITARQDSGIGNRKGEHSGVLEVGPRAIISPERETVRQQGRRIKDPNEPMFALTTQDRHGVVEYEIQTESLNNESECEPLDSRLCFAIRKLMPIECWRLQGFTDEQFYKAQNAGLSDARLYKMAGNAVSVPVIKELAAVIKRVHENWNKEADNGE